MLGDLWAKVCKVDITVDAQLKEAGKCWAQTACGGKQTCKESTKNMCNAIFASTETENVVD